MTRQKIDKLAAVLDIVAMSETKWTPGPWRVFICDDGGEWSGWPLSISPEKDDGKDVVRPGGFYPYQWDAATSQREAVANAHLIAAAPRLYEALSELEAYFEERADADHNGNGFVPNEEMRMLSLIRDSMAKARGETT